MCLFLLKLRKGIYYSYNDNSVNSYIYKYRFIITLNISQNYNLAYLQNQYQSVALFLLKEE